MYAVFAGILNGWEIILILSIILLLFGSSRLPGAARGLGGAQFGGFKRAVQGLLDELARLQGDHRPDYRGEVRETPPTDPAGAQLILWIAQGFGVGRVPLAPGTFGSLVGLIWFLLLLQSNHFGFFCLFSIVGVLGSVWVCGIAESVLRQKDPSSVVLDEIVAVPLCYLGWVAAYVLKTGGAPKPEYLFSSERWPLTLAILVLFRMFDILKPFPVRQSQSLPGGWGVTIDDVLAAAYVNVVWLAFHAATGVL